MPDAPKSDTPEAQPSKSPPPKPADEAESRPVVEPTKPRPTEEEIVVAQTVPQGPDPKTKPDAPADSQRRPPSEPAPPSGGPQKKPSWQPASAKKERPWQSEPSKPRAEEPQFEEPHGGRSQFDSEVARTLAKIRNWIIMGEEYLPEGSSMEFAIAIHWLLRIGVVILVIGVGFFLKHCIDENWINELGRVALATTAGFALVGIGVRLFGGDYRVLGEGLNGAGIGVLYFSVYAARFLYSLIEDPTLTFALMIGVTVLACAVAVRYDSLLSAILGALGGYLTPVVLLTGASHFGPFYGYLTVLSLGILGVAAVRDWILLRYISYGGTYLLVITSLIWYEYEDDKFFVVFPFLIIFFVIYSTMSFLSNLTHRKESGLLTLSTLFSNATLFCLISSVLITSRFGRFPTGYLTLALFAYYAAHAATLWRLKLDRPLLLGCVGLCAVFLSITAPIMLSSQWLAASWAVQAVVLLWLGFNLKSPVLRGAAYVLYGVTFVRFCVSDLFLEYFHQPQIETWSVYWPKMLERVVTSGTVIASLFGTYKLFRKHEEDLELRNDETLVLLLGSVGMLFGVLHLELNRMLAITCPPFRLPCLTLLWVGLCVWLLLEYERRGLKPLLVLFSLAAVAVLVKVCAIDLPATTFNLEEFAFGTGDDYSFVNAGMRLIDYVAIVGLAVFAVVRLRRIDDSVNEYVTHEDPARAIAGFAVILAFLFSTLEMNTFLGFFHPGFRMGGISLLWSAFALALLIVGLMKDVQIARFAGLGLFGVVAVKVFLIDLAHLSPAARWGAFLLLGILFICGSLAYLKTQKHLREAAQREDSQRQ